MEKERFIDKTRLNRLPRQVTTQRARSVKIAASTYRDELQQRLAIGKQALTKCNNRYFK